MTTAQSRHGGARVKIPPPFVCLASIGLGLIFHFWVIRLHVPLGRQAHFVVGPALLFLAFALGLPAQVLFRRSGQHPAPWKPSPSLVLDGPYRFTRNPMYLGMLLIQAGVGVLLDNLWVVLLASFSLVFVHFTAVLPEEAYLDEKFGEPDRQYRTRVRRYL